jgi:hypothetical protein
MRNESGTAAQPPLENSRGGFMHVGTDLNIRPHRDNIYRRRWRAGIEAKHEIIQYHVDEKGRVYSD